MTETIAKPRLLIVDDEVEVRGVLHDLLDDAYECVEAASAEEALAQLRETNYELVISDITMSGMTGLEMIPHVKVASPDTVIVMISGMQTIESAINALRLGAFDYLMKPFDLRQAEAAVARALEHHELVVAKQRYENHLEELVDQRTAELDKALGSLENAYRSTLRALTAALETRDAETHGHSERVVTFSLRLGREYGLTAPEMKALEFGSLLHDIGKIGVPDAILRKPSKAVTPTRPTAAMSWQSMPVGTGASAAAETVTYSAYPPVRSARTSPSRFIMVITQSPRRRSSTALPISSTFPRTSTPGTYGNG